MIPTKHREEKGPDRNSPRWKQYYLTLYPKAPNGSTLKLSKEQEELYRKRIDLMVSAEPVNPHDPISSFESFRNTMKM